MLARAKAGAIEGEWLRAERQTAGRGRQGRAWDSPVGNFYGSTLVRLRPADPPAATLGFVAAVALAEVVESALTPSSLPFRSPAANCSLSQGEREGGAQRRKGEGELQLKWPNDLLLGGAKLSGILLERADDGVVVGIGVNLAHHPDLPDRPTTSLAAHGVPVAPNAFADMLADGFGGWRDRWRTGGFAPVRARWLKLAHPPGTALTARLPDGSALAGTFDGLDADGALILRLATAERRVIHAADVFLV
ncbi:biotin--[acetyl-CoA-carboxylase] ligase [uncultured Sphingomonas sp.]|uniref:biotin--[acetyl-CoA-carboxylase] ligase n=1 Tax=uncultured Sphingomonas sp. TaxID=158754 RepID=UPI0035CB844F